MTDGEAILYDGGLWHASHNSRREGRRLALLLQYAAADTAVSIPDFSNPGWPFRFTEMRPPTIVVSGRGNHAVNRLVPPPTACPESHSVITTQVQKITVPLPEDENGWWRMCQLFCGSTPLLNFIECHLSVLSPGQSSHPSHVHAAESVHLVLDGELELQFGEGPASENEFCKLVSNSFVFYRAFVPHTNRNPGTTPTTYLALSWRAAPAEMNHFADASIVYFGKDWSSTNSDSHARQLPFDYPTSYLSNLHVNLITLPPGGGHDPQVNEYDVAILLLSGTVETLGQIVKAHSFVFCAAGESSGMRNVGNEPARYVVFEFHAPRRLYRNRVSFPLIQVPAADPPSKRPAQEFRSFWAGPPLSAYEKLSLRSLVARGQRVFLYSYDKSLQVPDGVDLCDANEILAGDHIHEFVHDNGETSPTLHANLFRYEVLRRFGGWYCDLDVVLVGNHPPSIDVYFAREDEAFINNAVLRFPPGAPLMVAAVEAARGLMTSTEWGASGPRLLTRLINDQGLSRLAQSWHAAYPVSPAEVRKLFLPEHREELEDRVAGADFVHLWNQIWRRVRLPKDYGPPEGSFLDSLFRSFEIRVAPGARMSEKAVRSWFGEFDIFDAAKRQRRNISGIGDLTDLTQALQQARWERDELLKSTSWRVTAPLRTVGRALQRLKDRLVDFGTHTAD
jgi:quercetin dioxygenase-like cupin family protein